MSNLFILSIFTALMTLTLSCTAQLPKGNPSPPKTEVTDSGDPNSVLEEKCRQREIAKGEVFWEGHISEFQVKWASDDLYIVSSSGEHRVFSKYAQKWASQVTEGQREATNTICFRVLSVVDTIVSVEIFDRIVGDRASTDSTTVKWVTFDMRKGSELPDETEDENAGNISLIDFWNEDQILEALLSNSRVGEAVKREGIKTPVSLDALFPNAYLSLDAPGMGGSQLDERFAKHFVFKEIRGNKAVISIEVVDRYNFHQIRPGYIDIELPIPAKLAPALDAANSGEIGFLNVLASKRFGGSHTLFLFRTD
jgi:hypothetical protein